MECFRIILFFRTELKLLYCVASSATINHIKSNLSLNSLYYVEAGNELAGPIPAPFRPGNSAPFEEMSQRWLAVDNSVSDLTGPIWTSDLPLQRRTRNRSTNWPVYNQSSNHNPVTTNDKYLE